MVNTLEIAQAQAKAGTLTDESKKALYDQYKTNLATTGDKTTALSQTQSQLSGTSTPKTVFTPNTGYQADQVGIPGVNISPVLPKVTPPKITPAPTGVVNGSTSTGTGTQNTGIVGKVETGMQTGTDVIGGDKTGFDTGSTILDKELGTIQTDKNKAIEDTKKSFLLGKAEFEKNKSYYTNYDEVNNLYTGVLDELTKSMDEYGVVSDARYSQIANKYGLTIDEVKNPNAILQRGNLSEEGKEKTGYNKLQSGIDNLETEKARKLADIERSLAQAQQNYDWQIEDVAQQLARNVGWTEAQGAWSGALRGSGYLQGIQNIKDDGQKTIDRLKILSERVKSASEEDLARVTEDYNKALGEAKKGLDTQLEDLKKNSILALSEAQATYGMGSDKLMKTLEKINEEYGLKSNQAVSAYLGNLKSMNDLANQNMNLVEKANQIETQKLDKQYNKYLENNGIVLQNTSLNTIATDLQNGLITVDRAKDLQSIMTSSIQSTLGALAPLTTQDLQTINTLLNQGLTPAEVIATMRQDERFKPKGEPVKVDKTIDLGDKTRIYYTDGSSEEVIKTDKPTQDWSKLSDTQLYNQRTGEIKSITPKQAGVIELQEGDVGGQCGTYARQYTGITTGLDAVVGTTAKDRVKSFTDNEPKEGGLVLFTGGNYDKQYGHIAVVKSVNGDGTIDITESNLNGDGKVTNRTVGVNEVTGFYNNTPLAKGEGGEEYSETVKGLVKGIGSLSDLTNTEKNKIVPELQKYIKSLETDDKDRNTILKSSVKDKSLNATTITKLEDMNTVKFQLEEISNRLNKQNVGPILGRIKKLNPYDTEAQVAIAQLAGLTPKVARGIFGEVGVLTDTDIANYQKALPNLTSTEEKNALVIDFMTKLLSEGYKNTLVTQAKAGVNVSGFLDDYDQIIRLQTPTGTTTENTYNANNGKIYQIKINPNK